MKTKNIQDVVAEILLLAQKGVRKVKDDDMTFEQFNEALRHHLTQLVKEERERVGEELMRRAEEGERWHSTDGGESGMISEPDGNYVDFDTLKKHIASVTGVET